MKIEALGNPKNYKQVVQTTTVRSFNGGWNVVDADLTMKSEFATVLDNMERGIDGTLTLRPGTLFFGQIAAASYIINMVYFNNQIIAVTDIGHVYSFDVTGTATHMQVSAADPWASASGTITQVNFTIFNGDLIMVDGVHVPMVIEGRAYTTAGVVNTRYNVLNLLGDAGNAYSNVNTPIAKYVVTHGRFVVMANLIGRPGHATASQRVDRPSSISIGARDTNGTFPLDNAPNDAVEISLGSRVSLGDSTITGLVSYRDKLLVTFERGVLPMTLGVYTGSPTAVHTPTDDGFIPEFGSWSHRALISVGDDAFYIDSIGVNSIQRVSLFSTLRPVRVSQLIDPAITTMLRQLTQSQINDKVFAVYDTRNKRYMLFVPNDGTAPTETVGFSYTNIPQLKVSAWARLKGWNWRCACRTALQNIYFAANNNIYKYDFDNTTSNTDFLNDPSSPAGNAISFTWELPWGDFNKRMETKRSVYVSMDTTGSAEFTLKMYTDNIRLDRDGVDAPALETVFEGGSLGGYGVAPYGNSPFGAGVPTADERLYSWPSAFKLAKFQVSGSTTKPLRIVSLSVAYQGGSIRR